MTNVLVQERCNSEALNLLPSKGNFDTFERINGKPTVGTVGLLGNSEAGASDNGSSDNTIIIDAPNLYKQIGTSMSEEAKERFVKIPRELLEDENFKGMRVSYQRLFLIILEEVSFQSRTYKKNGNTISVCPGQLCIAVRRLAELYNKGLRFKEDKITASLVQRAVSVFLQFGFAIHESIHGIMRLTITQRELYEHFKKQTDTQPDSKPILNRYTNEEREEGEELEETIDGAKALDSSPLNLEIEKEETKPSAFVAPIQPKLDQEKKKHFEILWKYISQNGMSEGHTANRKPGIKEKDLDVWIKKFEAKEIMECLKITLKAEPSKTWPGYMSKLLRDRISKKEEDSVKGRELVETVVKKNDMKHIELKKDYFKDLISDEQSYYHLPSDTLNAILKRSFERQKERDSEEKRQQEEEDKYY